MRLADYEFQLYTLLLGVGRGLQLSFFLLPLPWQKLNLSGDRRRDVSVFGGLCRRFGVLLLLLLVPFKHVYVDDSVAAMMIR